MTTTCEIDPDVLTSLKKFRFRKSKSNAAYILKIDPKQLKIVADEFLESSIEEIAEALPDNVPRFMILSYELNHSDGRVSYPLVGVYYVPDASSDTSKMLYASCKLYLFQQADVLGKVYDLKEAEEFTDEWLQAKLFASSTRP